MITFDLMLIERNIPVPKGSNSLSELRLKEVADTKFILDTFEVGDSTKRSVLNAIKFRDYLNTRSRRKCPEKSFSVVALNQEGTEVRIWRVK